MPSPPKPTDSKSESGTGKSESSPTECSLVHHGSREKMTADELERFTKYAVKSLRKGKTPDMSSENPRAKKSCLSAGSPGTMSNEDWENRWTNEENMPAWHREDYHEFLQHVEKEYFSEEMEEENSRSEVVY